MTRIKICGLTRARDVRLAADLGAWALGFVLTESPRQVNAETAAELISTARRPRDARADGSASTGTARADRAPLAVLVVTTEAPAWIAEALDHAGADGVQLSAGAEGPSVTQVRAAAAGLRRPPLVIAAADTPDARLADLTLLDARAGGVYGGTDRTLDWEALAADPSTPSRGVVLAGGLRPGNAGRAIHALRPFAVDVSSGVETAPGRKDHGLVRDFFAAVEHADTEAAAAERAGRHATARTRRTTG